MWEGIFKKEKKKDNTNQVSFLYGSCYSTPFLARQHDPLLDNGISLTRYSQYFIEKDKKIEYITYNKRNISEIFNFLCECESNHGRKYTPFFAFTNIKVYKTGLDYPSHNNRIVSFLNFSRKACNLYFF